MLHNGTFDYYFFFLADSTLSFDFILKLIVIKCHKSKKIQTSLLSCLKMLLICFLFCHTCSLIESKCQNNWCHIKCTVMCWIACIQRISISNMIVHYTFPLTKRKYDFRLDLCSSINWASEKSDYSGWFMNMSRAIRNSNLYGNHQKVLINMTHFVFCNELYLFGAHILNSVALL